MAWVPVCFFVEYIRCHWIPGQGLERERRDELACAACHHDVHVTSLLGQLAGDIRCLVGCNRRCHSEDDVHTRFGFRVPSFEFKLARLLACWKQLVLGTQNSKPETRNSKPRPTPHSGSAPGFFPTRLYNAQRAEKSRRHSLLRSECSARGQIG